MDEYGPQTEEIKKFLERVRNLTPEQAEGLDDAWESVGSNSTNAARHAVRWAVMNYGRHVEKRAAWRAVESAFGGDAGWEPLWDVTLVLVVKDKISEEHFNTLYGPWKLVMEK